MACAANADTAGVRAVHAAQHTHERRLARTVLAYQCVDLTWRDVERGVTVCDHGAEALLDVAHEDGGRCRLLLVVAVRQLTRSLPCDQRWVGTRMRPAMISRFNASTRACTAGGIMLRLLSS
jgi:hypothetical protein